MAWEELRQKVHNFQEEKELVGELVEISKSRYEGNDYTIRKEDDTCVTVYGKTAINSVMKGINIGTRLKIVYEGEMKNPNSGRMFHSFKVYRDNEHKPEPKEETIN